MTGVFRFIRHHDVADRMNEGWRYAGYLGPMHGSWSCLMWWCCGACKDNEVP